MGRGNLLKNADILEKFHDHIVYKTLRILTVIDCVVASEAPALSRSF